MPAQFQFMNYADVVGKAEGVKGQRLKNQLAGMQIGELQNSIEKRKRYDEIMAEFENRPARIAELHRVGLHDEAGKLETLHLGQLNGRLDYIKSIALVANPDNWSWVRENLISEIGMPGADLPVDYQKGWFKEEEDKALKALDIYNEQRNTPEDTVETRQMFRNLDTGITEEGPWIDPRKLKAKAGGAPKPPKFNELNAAADFFSLGFDGLVQQRADGTTYVDLKGEDAEKVQDMATLALKLRRNGMALDEVAEVARFRVMGAEIERYLPVAEGEDNPPRPLMPERWGNRLGWPKAGSQ